MLKKGKVPKEYKQYTTVEKKFSSKGAFLSDKDKEREYENRSYLNDASLKYLERDEQL